MRYCIIVLLVLSALSGIFMWSRVSADDSSANAEISGKLDTVIRGQQEILTAINSIKEEMRILKIRVTQTQ